MSGYVCPNGHPMPAHLPVTCRFGPCQAKVVYEPSARVLALERTLETLQAAVAWSDGDLVRNVLTAVVEEARKGEQPGVITFTEYGLACAIGQVVLRRLETPD